MNNSFRLALGIAAVAALGISGCGGGGGGAVPVAAPQTSDPATVPSSAAASTEAYINFQRSLSNDMIEPLTLQQFLPPQDDTAEPVPIG